MAQVRAATVQVQGREWTLGSSIVISENSSYQNQECGPTMPLSIQQMQGLVTIRSRFSGCETGIERHIM